MTSKIDVEQKIKEIGGKPWSPVEVARVNDQVVWVALFKDDYKWHKHTNEDELFYVYRGEIEIQFRDRENVILKEGEMAVVPKGVEHCPRSNGPSYVLIFEPRHVNSRGD